MNYRGKWTYDRDYDGVQFRLDGETWRARFVCHCGMWYEGRADNTDEAATIAGMRAAEDTAHRRECGW